VSKAETREGDKGTNRISQKKKWCQWSI